MHVDRDNPPRRAKLCDDCGEEIWADKNMVMLKDDLWEQICDDTLDDVCDDCIEKRLGRPIEVDDFKESDHFDIIPCNLFWLQEKHPEIYDALK